jgi:hypothetical protein
MFQSLQKKLVSKYQGKMENPCAYFTYAWKKLKYIYIRENNLNIHLQGGKEKSRKKNEKTTNCYKRMKKIKK